MSPWERLDGQLLDVLLRFLEHTLDVVEVGSRGGIPALLAPRV